MNALLVLTLLGSLEQVLSLTCLCTRYEENRLYTCYDRKNWYDSIYGNDIDGPCKVKAEYVIAPAGWKAVFADGMLLYLENDAKLYEEPCSRRYTITGTPKTDPNCPLQLQPGFGLLGPLPTTPTPTTPTTTTPTPTTPSTTQVPVPKPPPSQKCDITQALTHYGAHTSADHPNAKLCPDNTHTSPEALLLEICTSATPNYSAWKKELKVIDHCDKIPVGEPLSYFAGGVTPIGFSAIFWNCRNGNSFDIAFQSCGLILDIQNIDKITFLAKEFLYTVSF